jgi:hypothetical protein
MDADVEKTPQWAAAKVLYWRQLKKIYFSLRANKNGGADDVPRPLLAEKNDSKVVFW